MSNSRPREVLNAVHSVKEKGPPVADGTLSITADASEATELCSRRSALDFATTTSTYLEDPSDGAKPSDLYGKVTWKIERFSETSKRELRSNVFEVGQYKWYILVYPHGCDVCNHLSLFLCVADYDKLLPGWSHFAQFTIAVVNKDPKKSKYSDTLHRFCKKEHDWGWKKFMELSKVLDGFAVNDTLIIKAQVQVIKDHADRPFRCLDPYYRQELVRVYLSNVEGVCRRFIEQRREGLGSLRAQANSFRAFWKTLTRDMKKSITEETEEVLLKGLVKRFFNEKEVTSTLVMDAIFCGCKQIEERSRQWLEGSRSRAEAPEVLINRKNGVFSLGGDVMAMIESAVSENAGQNGKDDKESDAGTSRSSQADESIKDSIARDEHRLAELGRRTVEIYVVSHIFSERIEIAHQEAESLKRQEELLKEEEEATKREQQRRITKAQNEKEKRAKRNERKREKKAAERRQKENEEAERRRCEQEKRKEIERKRDEEQRQRRLMEEKLEKEHQAALEEARRRAEEREKEQAEKKKAEETAASAASRGREDPVQGEAVSLSTEPKTASNTEIEERVGNKAALESPKASKSLHISGAIAVKQREEIKKLHAKIHSLEKQVVDRDAHVLRLQEQIEQLKQREKELEAEVLSRTLPAKTPTESPCTTSLSDAAKVEESKRVKGPESAGARLRQPKTFLSTQSTISSKVAKSDEPLGNDLVPGRSPSSGDETGSDTTYADHSRCPSIMFNSVDHSQVSDCTTQETRSLSSFGTQQDHNGHESDGGVLTEVYRFGGGHDVTAEVPKSASSGSQLLHLHSHSVGLSHQSSLPVTQIFAGGSRANSVASCIPTRQPHGPPVTFPCNLSGRSYSLDASLRLPDGAAYAPCPSYSELSAMHDPLGLLCRPAQQTIPLPHLSNQQADMQRMHEGMTRNERCALEDFDHFSMIKDFLD